MTVSDENMGDLNMDALDALLSDAANDPAVQPNDGFMARVLDDALAQQQRANMQVFWSVFFTGMRAWSMTFLNRWSNL